MRSLYGALQLYGLPKMEDLRSAVGSSSKQLSLFSLVQPLGLRILETIDL